MSEAKTKYVKYVECIEGTEEHPRSDGVNASVKKGEVYAAVSDGSFYRLEGSSVLWSKTRFKLATAPAPVQAAPAEDELRVGDWVEFYKPEHHAAMRLNPLQITELFTHANGRPAFRHEGICPGFDYLKNVRKVNAKKTEERPVAHTLASAEGIEAKPTLLTTRRDCMDMLPTEKAMFERSQQRMAMEQAAAQRREKDLEAMAAVENAWVEVRKYSYDALAAARRRK